MSPVTKAAMPEASPIIKATMREMPMATTAIEGGRTGAPGLGRGGVTKPLTTEIRMKAATKPTDHLPKQVFGRILIRTMLSYATMWVEVNIPVRVCQRA